MAARRRVLPGKQALLAWLCKPQRLALRVFVPSRTALTRRISGRRRFQGNGLKVRVFTRKTLEAPPVTAVRALEELRHGLVAGPRLLLVVGDLRGLALAAGVHRFAIINPDRLVHAIPILPFPV